MKKNDIDLVLFCGGSMKFENSELPKPLHIINSDKTILQYFIENLPKDYFRKITLLVERSWVKSFQKIISNYLIDISIFQVNDHSLTVEKLFEYLINNHHQKSIFSYPDIFSEESFWKYQDHSSGSILMTKRPLSSRFPRVFSSPFDDVIKGVSDYESKIPANPHFIFAGKFQAENNSLKSYLNDFLTSDHLDKRLEVGFFDWLASKRLLVSNTYIDKWTIADGPRDYKEILNFKR